MLHQASTGAPCLSFDIIPDDLGQIREQFPLSAYIVAGTQAARTHVNSVIVMKMSNLHRTSKEKKDSDLESDASDEESDSDDEDDDKKPHMSCALIKHQGCVNRIRSTRFNNSTYAAAWSELGKVSIYNLNTQMEALEDAGSLKVYEASHGSELSKPVFAFNGHQLQGFAIDWCQTIPGYMATRDSRRNIHVWTTSENGWHVDQRPLAGHHNSVKEVQWSPNERNVLVRSSIDKKVSGFDECEVFFFISLLTPTKINNTYCSPSDPISGL